MCRWQGKERIRFSADRWVSRRRGSCCFLTAIWGFKHTKWTQWMLKWVALIWILKSKNFVRWGARKAENYRKRDPNVQKQAGDSLNNESQTDNSLSIYLVLGTARGDLNLHKTLDGNYSYLHFIEGKLEAQRDQVTFPKLTKHFNAELADPKPTLSGEKAPFSGTRSWERISICLFVCSSDKFITWWVAWSEVTGGDLERFYFVRGYGTSVLCLQSLKKLAAFARLRGENFRC